MISQGGAAGLGNGVEPFAALHLAADQLCFLEKVEGGVDNPGAGRVAAIEQVLDLADQVIAVARLLGQQRQHQQLEVAGGEYPWTAFTPAGAAFEGVVGGMFTHGSEAPCV
ncbi:hypothetical protein D3C79_973790 [compost metagenome]